jgi:hypothetical protein
VSLTTQLANRKSPVARFFVERFPNTRLIQKRWREGLADAETIRPPGASPPWGTIGTAFDYRVRYCFPSVQPRKYVATNGARLMSNPVAQEVYLELIGESQLRLPPLAAQLGEVYFKQFLPALEEWLQRHRPETRRLSISDERELARFCYVLALFEEFYRAGVQIRSPLYAVSSGVAVDRLLAIATPACVEDLPSLSCLFQERCGLLLDRPSVLNPTFVGSLSIGGADADLIVDGCLLEIKTTVTPSLSREVLYQLVGYVLLDFLNEYEIHSLGVYFSRQGRLVTWRLHELLEELAGEAVDISSTRQEFRALLSKTMTDRAAPVG